MSKFLSTPKPILQPWPIPRFYKMN
jgi:hypothetical protein